MNNSNEKYDNKTDQTLIVVKGNFSKDVLENKESTKKHVKAVSSAIYATISKHDKASLRCVGAASVNNAAKAIAKATEEFSKKEIHLKCVIKYVLVNFNENGDKNGILFEVTKG